MGSGPAGSTGVEVDALGCGLAVETTGVLGAPLGPGGTGVLGVTPLVEAQPGGSGPGAPVAPAVAPPVAPDGPQGLLLRVGVTDVTGGVVVAAGLLVTGFGGVLPSGPAVTEPPGLVTLGATALEAVPETMGAAPSDGVSCVLPQPVTKNASQILAPDTRDRFIATTSFNSPNN